MLQGVSQSEKFQAMTPSRLQEPISGHNYYTQLPSRLPLWNRPHLPNPDNENQTSCICGTLKFEADMDLSQRTGKCNCWKLQYWYIRIKPEPFVYSPVTR